MHLGVTVELLADRFSGSEKDSCITIELELQGGVVQTPLDVDVILTDITATGNVTSLQKAQTLLLNLVICVVRLKRSIDREKIWSFMCTKT